MLALAYCMHENVIRCFQANITIYVSTPKVNRINNHYHSEYQWNQLTVLGPFVCSICNVCYYQLLLSFWLNSQRFITITKRVINDCENTDHSKAAGTHLVCVLYMYIMDWPYLNSFYLTQMMKKKWINICTLCYCSQLLNSIWNLFTK